MSPSSPPVLPGVLRALSAQDFLAYGLAQIAYVRPIRVEGQVAWALHAADGTVLTIQNQAGVAAVLARQNDLDPVSLH
ncbi:MAG: DUF1150 family protein [Micavibrio aeruginosavorus]|uniref:DUF1150 family protein n=1 Tax=Micavibrio aeruginosavorus TaxID=349221 RepID=A0A7T5UHA9_9BACT|nr:MAG: DUF1150 family protein [Micavibrio aeruginosavorus]